MIFDDKPTVISRPRVTMIEDSTLFQLFKIEKGEPAPEKGSKMYFVVGVAIGLTLFALIILLWEFKRD